MTINATSVSEQSLNAFSIEFIDDKFQTLELDYCLENVTELMVLRFQALIQIVQKKLGILQSTITNKRAVMGKKIRDEQEDRIKNSSTLQLNQQKHILLKNDNAINDEINSDKEIHSMTLELYDISSQLEFLREFVTVLRYTLFKQQNQQIEMKGDKNRVKVN